MIQRFSFGCPLPTESVVLPVEPAAAAVPYLTAEPDGSWSFSLAEDAVVYGLGEMPRSINKRGWHYVTDNTDESHHGENRLSYYGAHNFLLIDGGAGRSVFGVFVDFPGKVFYDIGYTRHDRLTFRTEEPDYDLYILTGDSPNAVCTEFRKLIGHSYIPPKWAFGFAQSRWGYKTAEDVRAIARQYRENELPLDMICLDIDYMQRYADFTVNKERFPDLAALSAELKQQGIRLVPIIDAGVRIDPEDPTCTEGLEKGYFCTKADGTPFVAAVWPGKAYFADFLRPEVRGWFGHRYKVLTDCGIEGFWNDMNEPALFYSPERLRAFLDSMAQLREKDNLEQEEFFAKVVGGAMGLMNSPADYASFYHDLAGQQVRHDRVHNLYGGSMTALPGGLCRPAPRQAHPAVQPFQHHWQPPVRRHLAGRQPFQLGTAAGQHSDDAQCADVRLFVHRCRPVWFRGRHHPGPGPALAGVWPIHPTDAQPCRCRDPRAGIFPLCRPAARPAGDAAPALCPAALPVQRVHEERPGEHRLLPPAGL